jgi:PilZ domain
MAGQHLARMELRNRIRYRLSADVVFAWEGPQHNRLQGKGITRDISLNGAFILTATCPPIGSVVRVDVFLCPWSPGKKVHIQTEATVTRVDHRASSEGFAAVNQDFRLLFEGKRNNDVCVRSTEMVQKGIANV